MILEGETILSDDYPVYCGYAYVACGGKFPDDGEVIASDIQGTVAELRRVAGAAEIRRCELVKRTRANRESARETIGRLIAAVEARCPGLQLYDSTPLLPGQHAVRWIKGDRRARVSRRTDDDFFEIYCDPIPGGAGGEEVLGWQETVERIVRFACD